MQYQIPTLTRRSHLQSAAIATGGVAAVGTKTDVSSAASVSSPGFSVSVDTETADAQINSRHVVNREPAVEAFGADYWNVVMSVSIVSEPEQVGGGTGHVDLGGE